MADGVARAATPAAGPGKIIAILCVTAGAVRVSGPALKTHDSAAWEWLRPGARLDVAEDGRAVLAFFDGRRQELMPGTRARLAATGAVAEHGAVHDLPPWPALADVLALADVGAPSPRAGAVRVRAPQLGGLSPGQDAVTLASATVLSFEPLPGTPRYRVDVLDDAGTLVYGRATEAPPLAIPAEVLRPGARYTWKVRTVDRPGPAAEARESFRTLPAASAAARERLRAQVDATDPTALALFAAVDQRLGLVQTTSAER